MRETSGRESSHYQLSTMNVTVTTVPIRRPHRSLLETTEVSTQRGKKLGKFE